MTIDKTLLRELIPNVIHEAKGEVPLLGKLSPWLDSAKNWLEENFLGHEYDVPDTLMPLAEKIIVHKAFADAIPSLDLSLSPAGFAVISTEGRAPASKERVERLISSLNSFVDSNVAVLIVELLRRDDWIESPKGQWWGATFIPDLTEAYRFREHCPLIDTYRSMRSIAMRFEQEAAEYIIGDETLDHLRRSQFSSDKYKDIISMIRNAELRYISAHIRDKDNRCPDRHEVWHLMRPVIARLNYYPDLKQMWDDEMTGRFHIEPFKNDKKGGYFF